MSKTTMHRIYVGMRDNKGNKYYLKDLVKILNWYYSGYTITQGIGYYQGAQEDCYVVDLFDVLIGTKFIDQIKRELNQYCILVYSWEVEGGFE